ncbi:MAG: NUDIX hydrolase [Dehalococcoidia bacterium]
MTQSLTPYIDRARERLAGYEPRSLDAPGMKAAAVLALLYHDQGEDRVLLTVRTDRVEHHKGQISFPGGAVHDADENLSVTALRETWEEVGIRPEDVEIIGRLDDMVTISNFLVAPYVGVLSRTPYEFIPSELEVAEVIEPPLAALLDDASLEMEARDLDGQVRYSPAYHWNGHRIWGATARMLHDLLALLRAEPDAGRFTQNSEPRTENSDLP